MSRRMDSLQEARDQQRTQNWQVSRQVPDMTQKFDQLWAQCQFYFSKVKEHDAIIHNSENDQCLSIELGDRAKTIEMPLGIHQLQSSQQQQQLSRRPSESMRDHPLEIASSIRPADPGSSRSLQQLSRRPPESMRDHPPENASSIRPAGPGSLAGLVDRLVRSATPPPCARRGASASANSNSAAPALPSSLRPVPDQTALPAASAFPMQTTSLMGTASPVGNPPLAEPATPSPTRIMSPAHLLAEEDEGSLELFGSSSVFNESRALGYKAT